MTLLPLVRRTALPGSGARGLARRGVRPARRRAAAAVLLTCAVALGGCADLRLETPPPATPTPDAVEVVRDRTARDATQVAALATEAALSAPEAVATVLGRVAEVSLAHAEAFGGVYEPFPGTPEPGSSPGDGDGAAADPTATPTPTPTPPPADPAAVLDALATAATTARADADAAPDGDAGRLLASVWVSRTLLGETLAAAVAAAAGTPEAAPTPTATPVAVPAEPPLGVDVTDLATLVRSEDAAGMAWEVVAARSADAARADAAVRATLHRDRGEDWATAAGLARTDADPRRAAYDLPEALVVDGATAEAMAAAAVEVEAALGVTYTSLVARADAGARGPLLDAMLDQVRRGLVAGTPAPAFPGLPERA